ncbi:MAG: tetratricopeptide repeat protein [Bacteroidales bacterium]|nr:tetratricopeptide repeat protein [Bacteroidales bacterium]
MKNISVLFLSALIMCMLTPLHAQNDAAQRLYQEGIFQMEAMGDFNAAIQIFEKLVSDYPYNKPLASRALLMAGRCHEKLGRAEAEKAYKRILEEYSDQREIVNEARVRLMAISDRSMQEIYTGMITRKVWKGSDHCSLNDISADEEYVAFTDWATGDLALSELATNQTRRLTNKESWSESSAYALLPVFSYDGKYIAYTWSDNNDEYSLRMIDLESAEVQVLLQDKGLYVQPLEWAPDGKSIILLNNENYENYKLWQYFFEEDSLSLLKSFSEYFHPEKVAFSPDGKYIAYDHYSREPENRLNIYSIDLESKEQYELVIHPSENFACGWTPDGSQLIFISDRTGINAIWTIPVEEGKAAGIPEILKTDVSFSITPIRFTESGSFYYGVNSGSRDVYIASFNPEETEPFGPPEKISQQHEGLNRIAAWSSDGRFIAYTATRNKRDVTRSNAVIIHNVETGQNRNLILDLRMVFDYIAWSPDNKLIAVSAIYYKAGQQFQGLFILNTATGEITEMIEEGLIQKFLFKPAWSGDGKFLYYISRDQTDLQYFLTERNMQTGRQKVLLELSEDIVGTGNNWLTFELVYSSNENMLTFSRIATTEKRSDLFIIDLKDNTPKPRAIHTVYYPEVIRRALSFDGEEVVFIKSRLDEKNVQRDFELCSINIVSEEVRKIIDIPIEFRLFSLHPDGKTAVFNMGLLNNPCEIWAIDNLLPTRLNE